MPDQLLDTTGTGTGIAGQGHSHTPTDITVTVAITHTEVIPEHITDITTEAPQDTVTPTLITISMTHHTGDHPHIEVYQPIPEITAGADHAHYITLVRTPHLNPSPVPLRPLQNPKIRSKGES